ncbi:MAG: hypothetical protein WA734_08075 [Candidatus Acidiferrales bacterium]
MSQRTKSDFTGYGLLLVLVALAAVTTMKTLGIFRRNVSSTLLPTTPQLPEIHAFALWPSQESL